MNNQNEEKCDICELFSVYEQMISDGLEPVEAFHSIIEEVERVSYKDGFVDALYNVRQNVGKHIDEILEPCDCETCRNDDSCSN